MRRGKTTTYGQRGGDGPNTGKRAATYEATLPDGTTLTKRVFKHARDPRAPLPEGACVAVILPPINSYAAGVWVIGQDEQDLPGYALHAMRAKDGARRPYIVPARRIA